MSSRRLSDWISAYLEYVDDTEPPISYHTWTGLSLIAAALKRRCWIQWGPDRIYPNLYIVLVGPSGRTRKGTAMGMGKRIITGLPVNMVAESIIREALIRRMAGSADNFVDPDSGKTIVHCSLYVMSGELSVFLGQDNIKFLADLTDWYDSLDKWEYETKNSGKDFIAGVCLNLLGATAADWLQSILPQEAIGGGFTSRIIFIVEENKRKTIPLPSWTARHQELFDALRNDLERIMVLTGRFEFSPEAEQIYCNWYQEQDIKARRGILPIADPRLASYCERRATHVRKLSMLFSASRGDDLTINAGDFDRALKVLEAAEKKMPKVFGGLGTARYAQVTERIISFLARNQRTKRSTLLSNFYRDVDAEALLVIEATLERMGYIKISLNPTTNEATYDYTGPKLD